MADCAGTVLLCGIEAGCTRPYLRQVGPVLRHVSPHSLPHLQPPLPCPFSRTSVSDGGRERLKRGCER
jgi:hypothetical protein